VLLPADTLGGAVEPGAVPGAALGAVLGAALGDALGAVLRVGPAVEPGVAVGPGVGLAVVVPVGDDVAASAEGANGVNARAAETTSAIEKAGYATTTRARVRQAWSLFLRFTGSSLG
jgi:hypothetical protein